MSAKANYVEVLSKTQKLPVKNLEGSKQGTRSSITIISTLLFVTELDYPNNMLQFPGIQTARNSLLSNLNLKNKKKLK